MSNTYEEIRDEVLSASSYAIDRHRVVEYVERAYTAGVADGSAQAAATPESWFVDDKDGREIRIGDTVDRGGVPAEVVGLGVVAGMPAVIYGVGSFDYSWDVHVMPPDTRGKIIADMSKFMPGEEAEVFYARVKAAEVDA